MTKYTYRMTISRATRSREKRRTTVTALAALTAAVDYNRCPAAVVEEVAAGVPVVACTRRSPEIWTVPCKWVSGAAVCPDHCRRLRPAAGSAAAAARTRTGDVRTSWSSGDAWTPSRGCTWARTEGSGPVSSETRAVSCASSESPAVQNGRD